ncbi:hypothetical protein CONCODRAFT_169249 [Conidiobolus coronatus NRRL 28638]|uniref:Uncharacterized protein n=1 Tax=Conidiobolus coronatus (strain ATCC 28846 / CBS 209.66 / NRRL 28638) TaxID=796925 RepID=A0A137NS23_CONC2|nr:hypothetical protein CONCODRAFT_169249 [Conidiobolus coronatus NRRL 28638]|eukprot:KXN65569.1 hypothetical protein CONCODRAFT_169249 [Conidiobolus coronatus NRRL 28638]
MKFSTIFLTSAALIQAQITIRRQDGSSNPIDQVHNACRGIGGSPVNGASVPPGWIIQFFKGWGCSGEPAGFADARKFYTSNNPADFNSVKVIDESKYGQSYYTPGYYNYPGNYNSHYYGYPGY